MAEQAQAREQATTAHLAEMAERQRALAAEISLQRLALAGRLTDMLIALARTAYEETLSAPGPAPGDSGRRSSRSCRPICAPGLAVFYALGGQKLPTADELAGLAYSLTTEPIEMLKLAANSLGVLQRLAQV